MIDTTVAASPAEGDTTAAGSTHNTSPIRGTALPVIRDRLVWNVGWAQVTAYTTAVPGGGRVLAIESTLGEVQVAHAARPTPADLDLADTLATVLATYQQWCGRPEDTGPPAGGGTAGEGWSIIRIPSEARVDIATIIRPGTGPESRHCGYARRPSPSCRSRRRPT